VSLPKNGVSGLHSSRRYWGCRVHGRVSFTADRAQSRSLLGSGVPVDQDVILRLLQIYQNIS
jgi:hypothetical protein